MVRTLSVTLSWMSFSSRPGNSAVISISLSVSLRSMLGITSRDGKPAKFREKPSNKRSISCCSAENGLEMERVTLRSLPTGIRDFNVMDDPPNLSHISLGDISSQRQGFTVTEVKNRPACLLYSALEQCLLKQARAGGPRPSNPTRLVAVNLSALGRFCQEWLGFHNGAGKTVIQITPSSDGPPVVQKDFERAPIRDPAQDQEALLDHT